MNTLFARKHAGRNRVYHVAAIIIVAMMVSQPLIAADSWSRIEKLKSGTWIYVYYAEGKYTEGALLHADASGMSIRNINQGEVKFDRDLVMQVSVMHKKSRHWYSIPFAIAAAIAGGFGGGAIVKRTTCSDTPKKCRNAKGIIVGGLAGVSGGIAYTATRGKEFDRKVIYRKKR